MTATSFLASKPKDWISGLEGFHGYDVSADGQHIVAGDDPSQSAQVAWTRAVFVLNFLQELSRRVP
ncbi:MAG: hypothetical protein U0R19_29505 [Bryobacteraceae bacterium]